MPLLSDTESDGLALYIHITVETYIHTQCSVLYRVVVNVRVLLVSLGTLPQTYCSVATKEHVQEVLAVVGNLKPKPHPHHSMPRGTKLLVHCLLYHLRCCLDTHMICIIYNN